MLALGLVQRELQKARGPRQGQPLGGRKLDAVSQDGCHVFNDGAHARHAHAGGQFLHRMLAAPQAP